MPIPSVITDLTSVASGNFPVGADAVFPDLDNYLRAHASFIKQNYDSLSAKAATSALTAYATTASLSSATTAAPGSSLVGHMQSGASAVATTVMLKLRERWSLFDFMTSAQRSDVQAGTLLVDVTNAIQSAFDSGEKLEAPKGSYRQDGAVTSNTVPNIFGSGRGMTRFYPQMASGTAWEFNNTAGSYDESLLLRDFAIIGTDSGSCVGLRVEGAVYVNSELSNVLVQNMGGIGVHLDDCLTMMVRQVRAQGCNSAGIVVEQSNGITLVGCSAESNTSHGIYLDNNGTALGENFGATLIGCHSEANGTASGGHALYIKGHYGIAVLGGWYQCESTAAANANGAIVLDTAQYCRILGPLLSTGGTVTNLIGVSLVSAIFNDINVHCYGFAANRDIISDAGSGRNRIAGTGGLAQGGLGYTDSSSTGNAYDSWAGSGGNYGFERFAALHSFKMINGDEKFRVDSGGVRLLNHTSTSSASAGGASALPATPTGYITININGTDRKVAYY